MDCLKWKNLAVFQIYYNLSHGWAKMKDKKLYTQKSYEGNNTKLVMLNLSFVVNARVRFCQA